MATTRSKGKMADDKDKMTVVLSCKPLTFDLTGGGGGGGETKQLKKIEKNKEKAAVTVSKAVIELELVSEQKNKTDEDNLSARTTPYERLRALAQEEVKTIQKESIKKLIGNGTTVKAGKKHTWITHIVATTTSLSTPPRTLKTSDDISSPLKSSQESADVGVGDDNSSGEGGGKPEAEAGSEQEAKGNPAKEVIEPEPETSGHPGQVIETEAKGTPEVEAATETNSTIESGSNDKPEVEKATATEATPTPIIKETLDLNGDVARYRYLLNPNAFDHNPVMKARILKSMYDRNRRDMNLKRKYTQLETENKELKRMLRMTDNPSNSNNVLETLSLTFSSPPPNQNPPITSTTQSRPGPIVNTGFPFIRLPSVHRPTPIFQINNVSQSPREMPMASASSDNFVSELISPSTVPSPAPAPKPKRQRASSQQQLRRQPRRGSKKALMLEKEKALIENLYKKFAKEDKEEDLEVIVAEIQRMNKNKISLATTSTSAAAGSRRQPINNNDDEVQIIQEVQAPKGKVQLQDLTKRYSDVIFEEA